MEPDYQGQPITIPDAPPFVPGVTDQKYTPEKEKSTEPMTVPDNPPYVEGVTDKRYAPKVQEVSEFVEKASAPAGISTPDLYYLGADDIANSGLSQIESEKLVAQNNWVRESLANIENAVLDYENFLPESTKPVKNRALIRATMEAELGYDPPTIFEYETSRNQAYNKLFGKDLSEDLGDPEQAFVKALTNRAVIKKEDFEFYEKVDRQATLSAILGDGLIELQFGESVKDDPSFIRQKEKAIKRWAESQEAISDQYGDMIPKLRKTFRQMQSGDEWITQAGSVARTLNEEDKTKFLQVLRDLAVTYPTEELESGFKKLGLNLKKSGRGVSGAIDAAIVGTGDIVREGGTVSLADLFGGDEWYAKEQERKATDAKWAAAYRKEQDFVADVRRIFEEDYDPVRPLAEKGSTLRAVEEGVYAIPGAVTTTAMAFVPIVGMTATYGTIREFERQKYRGRLIANGVPREKAAEIAEALSTVSAAPQVLLEKLQANIVGGKSPIFSKVLGKVDNLLKTKATRFTGKFLAASLGETTIELMQELTSETVQDLASELQKEIPDIDWKNGKDGYFDGYFNKTITTFVAVAPLSFIPAARGLSADNRAAAIKTTPPLIRKAWGFTPKDNAAIDDSKTPSETTNAVEDALKNRDPQSESAKEGSEELEEKLKKEQEALKQLEDYGVIPSVRTSKDNKGFEVYDAQTDAVISYADTATEATEAVLDTIGMRENATQDVIDEMSSLIEAAKQVSKETGVTQEISPTQIVTPEMANKIFPESARRIAEESKLIEVAEGGTGAVTEAVFNPQQIVTGVAIPKGIQGRIEDVTKLYGGSNIFTLVHERSHHVRRELIARGELSEERQISFFRKLNAELKGRKTKTGQAVEFKGLGGDTVTETALDEAWAHFAEIAILRTRNGKKSKLRSLLNKNLSAMVKANVPGARQFKAFIRAMKDFFALDLTRAVILQKAVRDGKLDAAEMQEFEAMVLGETLQEQHEEQVLQSREELIGQEGPSFSLAKDIKPYKDRDGDEQGEPLTETEIKEGIEDEPGTLADVEIDDDKFSDSQAGEMSFSIAEKAPIITRSSLKGKKKFVYFSDRTRVGVYTGLNPKSGIKIDLQGGPKYPFIKGHGKAKAGWAFTTEGMFTRFAKRVASTDGIGLVTLYSKENLRANPTFLKAYVEEVKWAIKDGSLNEADFIEVTNNLREATVNSKKFKENSDWASLFQKEWKTVSDFSIAMETATFEIRSGMFFAYNAKKVGENKGSKIGGDKLVARGFPNISKMVDLFTDPDLDQLETGTIVSAVQFEPGQKSSSKAQEIGAENHLSYPVVIKGKGLGFFKKPIHLRKVLPVKAGKTERNMMRSAETSMGSASFSLGRSKVTLTANTQTFPTKDGGVVGPASFSISAFHGTPHKVDEFNTEQIGTGEGNQVYGWGLYFAQAKKVADGYRRTLSPRGNFLDGKPIVAGKDGNYTYEQAAANFIYNFGREEAERDMVDAVSQAVSPEQKSEAEAILKEIQNISLDRIGPGSLYIVELNVEQGELLDWDKPLKEQSEFIRKALNPLTTSANLKDSGPTGSYGKHKWTLDGVEVGGFIGGNASLAALKKGKPPEILFDENEIGASIYSILKGDLKQKSDTLVKFGIKGIRYLDGASRADGKGTSNYVIFNDADITITEKNGNPVNLLSPSFSIASDKMATSLVTDVTKRIKDPEARSEMFQRILNKITDIKRDVKSLTGSDINDINRRSKIEALEEEKENLKEIQVEVSEVSKDRVDEIKVELGAIDQAFETDVQKLKKQHENKVAKIGEDIVAKYNHRIEAAKGSAKKALVKEAKATQSERLKAERKRFSDEKKLAKSKIATEKAKLESQLKTADFEVKRQQAAREFEVSKEITKLEAQIADLKAKSKVSDIRDSLVALDAIVVSLPVELRGKVGGFTQISKLNTEEKRIEFLLKRMEKVDAVVETWIKGEYQKQIKKLFDRAKPKKDSKGILKSKIAAEYADRAMEIEKLSKMSAEELGKKTDAIQKEMEGEVDPETMDQLVNDLVEFLSFGNIKGMNAMALDGFYRNLNAVVETGKTLKEIADAEFKEEAEEVKAIVNNDVTGGKGRMLSSEAKLRKKERQKSVVPLSKIGAENIEIRGLSDFHRKNISFEWLMNNLSRENKEVGTLASETHKRLSTMVHVSTHNEKNANGQMQRRYQDFLSSVFKGKKGLSLSNTIYESLMEEQEKTGVIRIDYQGKGAFEKKKLRVSNIEAVLSGEATIETLGLTKSEWESAKAKYDEIKQSLIEKSESSRQTKQEAENKKAKKAEREPKKIESDPVSLKGNKPIEYKSANVGTPDNLTLSQAQAINLTMLFRQEGLRDSMIHEGYTEDTMKQMEEFLTPESIEIRDWLTNEYEENYNVVNEVFKKANGISLPKTEFYSPARRIAEGKVKDMDIDSYGTKSMSVTPTFTISRTTNFAQVDQSADAISIYMEHMVQTNHYISWAETVKMLRTVFSDKSVKQNVKDYAGSSLLSAINERLEWFADGGNRKATHLRWVDKLRIAHTYSSLSFNWGVGIKQLTSLPAYAFDMSFKDFAKYQFKFLKNPIANLKEMLREEYVQTRFKEGYERDVIDGLKNEKGLIVKGLQFGMLTGKIGDIIPVIAGGWMAKQRSYDMSIKEGLSEQEAKAKAKIDFEMITDRAQQAGDLKDLSSLQGGGSLFKMFTMYKTSPRQYYSNLYESFLDAKAGKKGSKKEFGRRLAIGQVILPLLFQFASDALRSFVDDDEDFEAENYLRAVLMGPLNGLFIAGDFAELGFSSIAGTRIWDEKIPILDGLTKAVRGLADIKNGEFIEGVDEVAVGIGKTMPSAPTYYTVIRRELKRFGIGD